MAETAAKTASSSQNTAPPRYSKWRIETAIYDGSMNTVDQFEDLQENWIEPPNVVVRRTRELADGRKIKYEDRGQLTPDLKITGTDGFKGEWRGQMLPNGAVYTQGTGGAADFIMVHTPVGDGEAWCMRRIDVHEPTGWLTPDELKPGRYYVTTVDRLVAASDDVPESLKRPLG